MKTEISLTQVLHALDDFLPQEFGPVTADNVVFAWETEVSFQTQPYQVSSEVLVKAAEFPGPFAASWAAGPDWWNASLIPFMDGGFLITVAAGRGVGNPYPNLNVSYERQALAEIINAKIVKTNSLMAAS